jgi:hypothetical protein
VRFEKKNEKVKWERCKKEGKKVDGKKIVKCLLENLKQDLNRGDSSEGYI